MRILTTSHTSGVVRCEYECDCSVGDGKENVLGGRY